jgi:hypothetical protein
VLGAISVLRAAPKRKSALCDWLAALRARKPAKVVAVALANKLARIVWVIITTGEGIVTLLPACGRAQGWLAKVMRKISYDGYRFPPEIIQQAIWLYLRFTLSFRDVEDLLAERGIVVSYETVRRWVGLSHCHGGEREASAAQGLSGRCDGGPPCVHRHSAKRAVRFG